MGKAASTRRGICCQLSRALAAVATLAAFFLASACLAASDPGTTSRSARERPPSMAAMLSDLVIERPLGVAESALGVALSAIAYPLAAPMGKSELIVNRCIRTPFRHTFERPLGDFSPPPPNRCSPVGLASQILGFSVALAMRPLDIVFGRSPFSNSQDSYPRGTEEEAEV